MKKGFLILSLLSILQLHAQNSPWSFGIEYSVQNISLSNSDNGYIFTGNNAFEGVTSFIYDNFSTGVFTNYELNNKLSLSSGLFYSNRDFIGIYVCPACTVIDIAPLKMRQRFLNIPIRVNYQITKGKLRPLVEAGFQNSFNVKSDSNLNNNAYFLELLFGGALTYQFGNHIILGAGYRYTTSVTNAYKLSNVRFRANSYFLQLQLKI